MLFLKNEPAGIDVKIQRLQTHVFGRLTTSSMPITAGTYQAYGRAYANNTPDGIMPEVFVGGRDYQQVLFEDRYNLVSFCTVEDTIQVKGTNQAKVQMVFFANVAALKPGLAHRADEEVRNDVQKVIEKNPYGFEVTSIEIGINKVMSRFTGWMKTTGLQFADMQPFHCFQVTMQINYSIHNC